MRPALKAGLLPVWRDRDTLQFGVDPRRARALGGLGPAAAVISLLDGSRDRDALIATAQAYGIPGEAVSRVLALLAEAGVLDDFPFGLHASLPDRVRARLAPELATAALAYADTDGGARTLARRRAAFVRVHGAGRTVASLVVHTRADSFKVPEANESARDLRTVTGRPDLRPVSGPRSTDHLDANYRRVQGLVGLGG